MKRGTSTEPATLTEAQAAQLQALDGNPDVSDLPEAPADNWAGATRLHKVNRKKEHKEVVSLSIDADVLNWLRRRGGRYEAEIIRILRRQMEAEADAANHSTARR